MTVTLRADVTLDHARIVLADVATVSGADGDAVQTLEHLEIGHAPRIAYVEKLSRAQLEQLIRRRAGPAADGLAMDGATVVSLRTAAQAIAEDSVLKVAKDRLQQQFGGAYWRLDVEALATPEGLEVPVGAYQLRARPLGGTTLASRMTVWVDVIVDGLPYRSVLVPLHVQAMRHVYVARKPMRQGAELVPADLALELRDVVGLKGVPLGEADVQQGGKLQHALAEGQVLTLRDQAARGQVMRGDRVRLALAAGAVRVETMALADSDAAIGELVKVRPDNGSALVAARVVAPGIVEVESK